MEGDLQRAVGRNLRAFRTSRGLSQEAFAEVVGVHRTYMGGLERGERNLTLRSVERLANRLDLSPMQLLQAASPPDTSWSPSVDVLIAATGKRTSPTKPAR
jgi:transcriptional regulator with XRE-family HTH domain